MISRSSSLASIHARHILERDLSSVAWRAGAPALPNDKAFSRRLHLRIMRTTRRPARISGARFQSSLQRPAAVVTSRMLIVHTLVTQVLDQSG